MSEYFVTTWTVAFQAPLSMEFSRQAFYGGLPFRFPGDLPNPRIEPMLNPASAGRLFTLSHQGNHMCVTKFYLFSHIIGGVVETFSTFSSD